MPRNVAPKESLSREYQERRFKVEFNVKQLYSKFSFVQFTEVNKGEVNV